MCWKHWQHKKEHPWQEVRTVQKKEQLLLHIGSWHRYLDRIPIARQTTAFAEEIHTDPVVAALNGGEDYELLFTVPLALQERLVKCLFI